MDCLKNMENLKLVKAVSKNPLAIKAHDYNFFAHATIQSKYRGIIDDFYVNFKQLDYLYNVREIPGSISMQVMSQSRLAI